MQRARERRVKNTWWIAVRRLLRLVTRVTTLLGAWVSLALHCLLTAMEKGEGSLTSGVTLTADFSSCAT